MRSAILYGSRTKLSNAHKPVFTPSPNQLPNGAIAQPEYYVRMKVVNTDIETALAAAKPQPGETVLNTVELGDLIIEGLTSGEEKAE